MLTCVRPLQQLCGYINEIVRSDKFRDSRPKIVGERAK